MRENDQKPAVHQERESRGEREAQRTYQRPKEREFFIKYHIIMSICIINEIASTETKPAKTNTQMLGTIEPDYVFCPRSPVLWSRVFV